MVCAWGMSDVIGPMTIGKDQGEVYLGKDILSRDTYSDETTRMVDNEIRAIIAEAHDQAKDILQKHRGLLDALSHELQEKETLGTEEIFKLIMDHLQTDERAIVEKKYARAREMRFEHSKDDIEPEAPSSEVAEIQPEEEPSV